MDRDGRRRWLAWAAVSLATFMAGLDNSVVNVALPTIEHGLDLPLSGLEWVVSGYILTFAGLMLAGGRLGDIYGTRRVFGIGVTVFTAASLAAGLSPTAEVLIASRAVQGVGAALLTPTALAILPAVFTETRERNRAIGLWGAVSALSLAAGPVTGGVIAEQWAWGWIFWINVPLGMIAYRLAQVSIPASGPARAGRRLDISGIATSTVALTGLTIALIEAGDHGWTSPLVLGALATAAFAAAAFVAVERGAADPMIDLTLFADRVYSGGTLALGLWSFGVFGVYFFTSLYLQNVLGLSPTAAGAAFVPLAVITAMVATLSEHITHRIGTGRTVAVAFVVMAAAVAGVASIGPDGTLAAMMPWLLLYGIGAGLLIPLNSVVLAALPATRAGAASGVLNATREMFGLLGVAVLGAVLTARQADRLTAGHNPLSAFVSGYQYTLLIAAAVLAAGVPLSLYSFRHRRRQPEVTAVPPRALQDV